MSDPKNYTKVINADDASHFRVSAINTVVENPDANDLRVSALQPRYDYRFVSAASSTNVKTGAGTLHTLVICDGDAKSIKLYDSETHGNNQIGYLDAPADGTYKFDCKLSAGLTVSCESASNITVNYL